MADFKFPVTFVFFLNFIRSEVFKYEEFEIIEAIGESLDAQNYIFVQNEIDRLIIRELKFFSNAKYYSAVLSSEQLNDLLNIKKQTYFKRKTLVVTKHDLNFTKLLPKVTGALLIYWVVFMTSTDIFQATYIPANADLFVVQPKGNETVINKVYHLKPGMNLTTKEIAVWKSRGSTDFRALRTFDFIDFENITLNTLVYQSDHNCKTKPKLPALPRMECFQQEMIRITAEKLNFTINKIVCPERKFPFNYPNGSVSTLFLMLERHEVDLSSASYIVNSNRLEKYDFAWPTFTTKTMMYIKFFSHRSYWRAYLRPLNRRLWYAIVSYILVAGITIQVFRSFHSRRFRPLRMIYSILVSFQVPCNQSLPKMPQWNSNRIVYLVSFFLFLIIYQVYSGGLISSLTIKIPRIPFTDFRGFFRDGTFKIMTVKNSFHTYYLKTFVLQRETHDLMLKDEMLPATVNEAISFLCTSKRTTFIDFRENIVMHDHPCKIVELPKPLMYQSIGLGFPKNSPYRKFINREITLLHSTGIFQRMRTHLFSYVKLKQKDVSNTDYVPVNLRKLVSIFTLLTAGTILSITIFLLEVIWHKIQTFLQQRNSKIFKKRNRTFVVFKRKRNFPKITFRRK